MKKILFIRNAAQLITMKSDSGGPLTGKGMNNLEITKNGSLCIEDGIIRHVGQDADVVAFIGERITEAEIIDATGKIVTPGLIDSHTHITYGSSREKEFEMRLNGASYMDIMNAGGGIHRTTKDTRSATEKELYEETYARLDTSLLYGTTTIEAKSGYGLTTEHELKLLRVAQKLNEDHPIDIASTFLGAHAVPAEYEKNPDRYVDLVIDEMIPKVVEGKLAEFIDVFCEKDVFTPEQAERILRAGQKHGLIPKIHADEIVQYGGAELAAKIGAISAEHLLQVSDDGIKQMANAGVVAVLLPGTPFMLKMEPAPARKMIDAGVPVALSTDNNPGTSPTESLPFMMNLGCLTMDMTPAEVLTATTINAAHAINRSKEIGSLEVGKKGDAVIFDAENYAFIQYKFGVNLVDTVIKNGEIVVENNQISK